MDPMTMDEKEKYLRDLDHDINQIRQTRAITLLGNLNARIERKGHNKL